MLKLIPVAALFLLSSCATFQGGASSQAAALVAPSAVQSDIMSAALIAKPYLTAQEVADVTAIKTAVQSLANGTLPIAQFQQLIAAKLPAKHAPALSIALTAASALFAQAYTQYGLANSTFTAYCTAFYAGLASAGF